METRFYLTVRPRTELARQLREALAKNSHPTPYYKGCRLNYDRSSGEWYLYYDGITFSLPHYAHRAGLTVSQVMVYKGNIVLDDNKAYQGLYRGEDEYDGCTARVDNYVSSKSGAGVQSVQVTAPPEKVKEYYSRIRARLERPTLWWERPVPEGVA